MKFDIHFELPVEVAPSEKKTYSIKVIGGPEEYKKYLEEKAIRLEAEKKAKHEAYLIKRVLLEDILLGEAQASEEALKEPETLEFFKTGKIKKAKEFDFSSLGKVQQMNQSTSQKLKSRLLKWFSGVFEK